MEKTFNPNSDPHGDEWKESTMDFKPGRFYHAMGFVHVPCMGEFGGDVLCSIWRFDDEPTTWNVTLRFRYYAGENTDPWKGGDRKSWNVYRGRIAQDVSEIRKEFETITLLAPILKGQQPEPMDWIMLDGNAEHASKVMFETEKPWLHKQVEKFEAPNG